MEPKFKRILAAATLSAAAVASAPFLVNAAGDLTAQEPIRITVSLGNEKGELKFFPDAISLETGKLYLLTLINPSPVAHYFSSDDLARSVFTRKVQVNGPDGKPVAEIKGNVREIEVYPGGTTEWWFVPVKTGGFNDLKCTVKGHAEGGMVGKIAIK